MRDVSGLDPIGQQIADVLMRGFPGLTDAMMQPKVVALRKIVDDALRSAELDAQIAEPLAIDSVLASIRAQVMLAEGKHKPMNSPHEGYAVILEELDELWDEVRKQTSQRSTLAMERESIQIAAMAVRFILNVVLEVPATYRVRS